LDKFLALFLLLGAFGCGYGLREMISRRRRTAARTAAKSRIDFEWLSV